MCHALEKCVAHIINPNVTLMSRDSRTSSKIGT
jgi:hypothetical protein